MRIKVSALSVGKLLFTVFVLYAYWFREAFGVKQIILYGSAILLTVAVLFDMLMQRKAHLRHFPEIVGVYFVVTIYALVTGVLVAPKMEACIASIISFAAYSVVCFDAYYISNRENDYRWILRVLILCGCICAAHIFFKGYTYRTSGVDAITLGPENNPNFLGLAMLTSVFALILDCDYFKRRMIIKIGLLVMFSSVIILTASRKSFICLAILLIGWIITFLSELQKSDGTHGAYKLKKRDFVYLIIVFGGLIASAVYMARNFEGTTVYTKLLKSVNSGEGVESRMLLYREAWQMFKSHPLLGVGFDQYRVYSSIGKYSHSTYAELLSCLGLIGAAIFLIPLFKKYTAIIKSVWRKNTRIYTNVIILTMFTAELVMGTGQIFIYEFPHLLVLMLIFYGYNLSIPEEPVK